jgi:hypothetical protein
VSRPLELVRAYDARGARRKARLAESVRQRQARTKAEWGRRKRAAARRAKANRARANAVRALPADMRAAYDQAGREVRRLILEQHKDDQVRHIKTSVSLDAVLEWKEAV